MEWLWIVIVIVEAVAIAVLAVLYGKSCQSNKRIMENAKQVAKGKLNVDDVMVQGTESKASVIAGSFNVIKSNFLTFLESTKGNVIVLSDAIDVLSNSVEANQDANEQIAEGVTSVAVKSSEQLQLVRDNLEIIEDNNICMADIQQEMDQIESVLDSTVDFSKSGVNTLEGYKKDIAEVSEGLGSVNKVLDEFNYEITQIEEVGDFIIDVSEQLMLLAFNASIEAARAGESGKGFAVVADEMNEMSIKTKEGMGTINQIVSQIKESSKLINECVQNCQQTFDDSRDTFELVNKSFRSICDYSMDVQKKMQEISKQFVVISRNSDVSKNKATTLYDASVSISESTHEIAAASQMTAAESSQIGANVEELRNMLTGIQNLLKQFDTSVIPADQIPEKKIRIIFLSMLDNDFWYGVRRGVHYAMQELSVKNTEIEYIPCDMSNIDTNIEYAVKRCVEEGVEALIIPGFLTGGRPVLENLLHCGTKIFTYNCDGGLELGRIACFSPDSKEAGVIAAKVLQKKLDKKMNVGVIYGDQTVDGYNHRRAGFMEQIKGTKGIHIISEIEVLDTEEDVYNKSMQMMKDCPDLDVIFYIAGIPKAVVRAVEDSNKVGKVSVVCFDHSKEIFDAIKKGIILSSIGQDAFGQGHDPIIWAYNHIVTGEALPSENMVCRSSVVDKMNVDNMLEA